MLDCRCCTGLNSVSLRQTGAWDALLQCLHLDTHLLVQKNTKKLQGTKTNCTHVHMGQRRNSKIQKGHKPTAISELPGAKARYYESSLYTAPPRGWADHLSHPSSPTHQSIHPHRHPIYGNSKGTCHWFSLPGATARVLTKPCLNFSSGLLQCLVI